MKICLAYKLDYEMFKIHCENIIQALLLKSTLKLRTKLGLDQLGQGIYTYLERSQGIYTYLERSQGILYILTLNEAKIYNIYLP